MALKPTTKVEKTEEPSNTKPNTDDTTNDSADALRIDGGTGKAINEGDENAQPSSDTGAVSPDAPENNEPAPVTEPVPTSDETYVYVVNLKGHAQRQPSTNTWIAVGGGQYFAEDGWLENQLKYGLLKKAKDPAKKEKEKE